MFLHFIEQLRGSLQSQILPGLQAQLLMAPKGRDFTQPSKKVVNAAVLIILLPAEEGVSFILTKRHDYDGPHSGQVSFPGGKEDKEDLSAEKTALRETEEEIGIQSEKLELIGKLTDLYIPVSNYLVHPFVAYTAETPVYRLDPTEVKYILESNIHELFEEKTRCSTLMNIRGTEYEIPYFSLQGEEVWGATAMILSEFIEIARPIYFRLAQ
jgi:8-oxo-dGTP pyrophosphatase MutT (NUDIX family)